MLSQATFGPVAFRLVIQVQAAWGHGLRSRGQACWFQESK